MRKNIFLIATLSLSIWKVSALHAMHEDEILQSIGGNYQITQVHPTLPKCLLTWQDETREKKAPNGYYVQVIDKSEKVQEHFDNMEKWINTNLWSVLPAENNFYTIKNISLHCGFLSWSPNEQHVQVLEGERYVGTEIDYMPGGSLRNNVLWRIDRVDGDDVNRFYTIRNRHNNGFLSVSTENTFFGHNLNVVEDHHSQSFLEKNHAMRNHILWKLEKKELYQSL